MLLAYLLVAMTFAVAVTLLLRGVFAPAPKLRDLADGTYRARSAQVGMQTRLREWLLRALPPDAALPRTLHADLRITRTVEENHVVSKFGTAAMFGALGVAVTLLPRLADVELPMLAAVPVGLVAAVGGFFVPDLAVRDQAKTRRREFVSAFAAYLDLTRILMGASDGPESALEKAAERGHGWVFAEIRRALDLARGDQTMQHWDALGQLGAELDIVEVREFADSMAATATSSGLPATLGARASTIRHKALREIEGNANANTEKTDMPMTMLTLSSTLFIMFAALNLSNPF